MKIGDVFIITGDYHAGADFISVKNKICKIIHVNDEWSGSISFQFYDFINGHDGEDGSGLDGYCWVVYKDEIIEYGFKKVKTNDRG